jgi:cytochrome c oxidase cbb3-type subunit I/II
MLYYLVPKLWNTQLYSVRWANIHFWSGTIGILLYVIAMWASGITQGLMLNAVDQNGQLVYPDFVETVMRIAPLYWVRALGGLFFLGGFILMLVNIFKTIALAPQEQKTQIVSAPALKIDIDASLKGRPHRILEGLPSVFAILTFMAIIVGSVIEIVPTLLLPTYAEINPLIKPYTPLQLAGRDIYIREGCYVCHSQMIRSMLPDVIRYGAASEAQESMYDHPFQWGSRRTGPDLARIGGKYPDLWHYRHMIDPREVTPQSIMPVYSWLAKDKTDFDILPKKLSVMKTLGVPYTDQDIRFAAENAREEAKKIAAVLEQQGAAPGSADRELVALISYLQSLGRKDGGKK